VKERDPELHTIALHAVLAGLCPLVPIPFLDDALERRVRKSLGRSLAPELPRPSSDYLAGAFETRVGCAWMILLPFKLAGKLVLKLFRKITIILSLKQAVDTTSRVLHEGWLIAYARREGHLLDPNYPPSVVRAAIETACRNIDPRPVEQAIKRLYRASRSTLRKAMRLLVAARGKAVPLAAEDEVLGSMLDEVGATLGSAGYRADLEAAYREALAAGGDGGLGS
jgi:hypothetical protein